MGARETTGLQQNQVLKRSRVYRDVRPFYQRWYDDWMHPAPAMKFAWISLMAMIIMPSIMDFLLACILVQGTVTFLRYSDGHFRLPMRLPKYCHYKKDLASRVASQAAKYKKAEGIFYIGMGTDKGLDYELWLNQKDMGTHTLILGTTGAGKTVAMQALAYSFLAVGGGLMYVDPKASPSLLFEFFVMCRRLGRDCDMRILSFAKDKMSSSLEKSITAKPNRVSNTMNPLSTCTAADIVTILCSLLPKEDGGNQVFKQKGILLVRALVPLLVKLRDKKMIDLSMTVLNSYMDANNSVCLVFPKNPDEKKQYEAFEDTIKATVDMKRKEVAQSGFKPTPEQEQTWRKTAISMYVESRTNPDGTVDLPDFIRYQSIFEPMEIEAMKSMLRSVNYMDSLPLTGGEGKSSGGQPQTFFDQYAYGRGYFSEAMATMSQEFGAIFNPPAGEADVFDVIFNNRVLIVNITSMSLSPDETSTIGKIVLSQIKGGIAFGIPADIEGSSEKVLGAQVSVARAPMGVFVDEYAAISTPGFAVVCTQARSLGFCAVIGTQDIPGLEKADKNESGMIIANTSVKYFMRQKDPADTYKLVKDLFGDRFVQKFDQEDRDSKGGQVEKVAAVDLEDLKQQNEGEFHCSFDDMLIRGKFPYMVPNTEKKGVQLRLIRDVVTPLPDPELIRGIVSVQKECSRQLGCMSCWSKEAMEEAKAA